MKRISLQTLRTLVDSTKGQRLPTVKALRESGCEVVASAPVGNAGHLTVYENGFYTYQTESGATVYAVDRCAGYAYDGGDALDAALFEGEDWTVRLVLAGEDRLEHNNTAREEGGHFSYSADTVERADLRDPGDFVAEFESRDAVARMLEGLTDKQRQIVQMHFVQGFAQKDIAAELAIGQRAVSYALEAAMKKLKKYFQRYF